MSKSLALCLLATAVLSQTLNAQEQRWFEIEIIVFNQTPPANLLENFTDTTTAIKPGRAIDILTPRYQPNINALLNTLPVCLQQSPLQWSDSFSPALMSELCIIEQQLPLWAHNTLFQGRQYNSHVPFPARLGPRITGSGYHQARPYLADAAALQLTDIAQKISRQAGKQLLLHTAWRQAPVTERLAIASRWYSGANYSAQFDYWGQPLPALNTDNAISIASDNIDIAYQSDAITQDSDMLQHIDQLLQLLAADRALPEVQASDIANSTNMHNNTSISTLPEQVWQLDGLFKLHLDHYLFVNTEFNVRLPQADKLQTVHVRQSRRVISGEIHYLDHPYLGIVLQIRRYEPAAPAAKDEFVTNN